MFNVFIFILSNLNFEIELSPLIFYFLSYLLKLCLFVSSTAVQLGFNPLSQFVPQLEHYSQLQLSLWNDPIAFCVPKPT